MGSKRQIVILSNTIHSSLSSQFSSLSSSFSSSAFSFFPLLSHPTPSFACLSPFSASFSFPISTMSSSSNGTSVPTVAPQCCEPGNPASPANFTPHPSGHEVKIGGVDCYSVGEGNKAAVIISTDIFGYRFPSVRANADRIAAAGFHVIIPDQFEGDVVTPEQFQAGGMDWLRANWWPKHEQDKAAQHLIKVAQALKKEGNAQSIQAIGYCYGAVGVVLLLKEGLASSGVVAHPTGFNNDNVNLVNSPLLIECAEIDQAFTPAIRQHWEATLKARGAPTKFVDFPGTVHGFAVRDDGSENGVLQRQNALNEAIAFLKQGAAA